MVYIPGKTGNSDILLHYGVLGMKWGVRRARQNKASAKIPSMKDSVNIGKSNYLYWKELADDTQRNRSLAKINETTHKRLHKDIRKIIDNEAMELNGKGIDKKSGDLFVRSQISQAYKNISQLGYKINSYDDLKRAVLEDTDVYQSDLISTAYRYNPYAYTDTGGGKVSTKKERKRLGISKEFEENMIRDMIRYEAEKNNRSVSYHDVKTMLKNDYRELIELEEMDRY